MKCGTRGSLKMQKSPSRHHRTNVSTSIFAAKEYIDNRKKYLLNIDTSSTRRHNMVNFGLLTAEICWRLWGTPAHFNGFRVLAALLHGTLAVDVEQTAPPIFQGGHHVGHWPTFLVRSQFSLRLPYGIGQAIVFCPVVSFLLMAALYVIGGHYIFVLWFLPSIYLSFFRRLISAVAEWMPTILPYMVWP